MKQTCLLIVGLFIRRIQHEYTRLSCWLGVFERTMLWKWDVKSPHENRQLNVACANFPADPRLQIFRLYSAASPGVSRMSFKFAFSWSLSALSLSRPLALSTSNSQSPRSSRPRSKDFLAFVVLWPPARFHYRTLRFYKKLNSNKNDKPPNKSTKVHNVKNQTKINQFNI